MILFGVEMHTIRQENCWVGLRLEAGKGRWGLRLVEKQLTLWWDTRVSGLSHQHSSSDLGHVTAGSPYCLYILATLTYKHIYGADTPPAIPDISASRRARQATTHIYLIASLSLTVSLASCREKYWPGGHWLIARMKLNHPSSQCNA